MAVASGDRSVAVGGDVANSFIVTGDNVTLNVRLDAAEGALLDRLAQEAVLVPLPVPLDSRPRLHANHVDRDKEAQALLSAAAQSGAANVYGEPGIGKSHLLAHASRLPAASALPDGIAYVADGEAPLDDVLQALFEEFYDPGVPPVRPTRNRLRRELRGRQAVVLVDGLELEPDDARAVLETAPGCRVVAASTERRLWDAAPLRLEGLELPYALELVEQELGRPLAPEEAPDAERLCRALAGHPWRIREAVARARDEGGSLAEAARALDSSDLLEALDAGERSVLAGLAAAGGGPVGLDRLRELSAAEDVDSVLPGLERRHLVRSHSPRYSLPPPLLAEIEGRWDLDATRAHALGHYVEWSERNRSKAQVAEERPALLSLLRWAARSGRDDEAIRLGRAADRALAGSGRFGSWGEAVAVVLGAARRRGDPAAEAWALNQRGAAAACVGSGIAAVADLEAARALRERIGDHAGEAVSRHNLEVLRGVVGGGGAEGGGGGGHGPAFFVTIALLAAVVVALVVVGGLFAYDRLAGDDGATTTAPTTVELVTVPDVVGLALGEADSVLQAAGLNHVDEPRFADAPEGEVLDQEPSAGDEVEPGTIVVLAVSRGPAPPTTTEEPPLPEIDLAVRIADYSEGCQGPEGPCVTVAFAVTTENGTDLPATFDAIVTVDPEAAKLEQSLATADGTPFVVHVPLAEPCRANCTITVVAAPDGTFTDPNLENNVARVLPPVLE